MRSVLRAGVIAIAAALAGSLSVQAQQAPLPAAGPFQNPDAKPEPPLKAGANSFAEGQARKLLESKGYANVSTLVNDSSGIWRGTATRDERQVAVSVDFQGHVTER